MRYYTENQTALEIYALLSMASLALFVVFISQLRSLLRQTGPAASLLADTAFAGGLLCAVGIWVSASLAGFTAVVDDVAAVDPAMLRTWYSLHEIEEYFSDLAGVPQGLFITAVSVGAVRYAVLPRWLGWLGLVIGIACLTVLISFALPDTAALSSFFLGLFGFML